MLRAIICLNHLSLTTTDSHILNRSANLTFLKLEIVEEEYWHEAIDEDNNKRKDHTEFELIVQNPTSDETLSGETEMTRTRRKSPYSCHTRLTVSEDHVRNVTPPVRGKNDPATFQNRENAENTHGESPRNGLAGHQYPRKQYASEGELSKFCKLLR